MQIDGPIEASEPRLGRRSIEASPSMQIDGPIEAVGSTRAPGPSATSPSMQIDGPIEAWRVWLGIRVDPRLRRCRSTAPLKLGDSRVIAVGDQESPSMQIDGPIKPCGAARRA